MYAANSGPAVQAAGQSDTYVLQAGAVQGAFFDRSGQMLTQYTQTPVYAVAPTLENGAYLTGMLGDQMREVLYTALYTGKPFLLAADTPLQCAGISELCTYTRSQPQWLRCLVGTPNAGLEKALAGELTKTALQSSVRYSLCDDGSVADTQIMGTDGMAGGVVLTIDKALQQTAVQAVSGLRQGCAVVLDCETGEILAMAGQDPGEQAQTYLPLCLQSFPAGRIFTGVVCAALIESGNDQIANFNCTGSLQQNGQWWQSCDRPHGAISTVGAFTNDCTCFFSALPVLLPRDSVLLLAQQLQLGTSALLFDSYAADSGTLPADNATAAFFNGDGVSCTPLQAASALGAMVQGKTISPRLVRGTVDAQQNLLQAYENDACSQSRTLQARTVRKMQYFLQKSAAAAFGERLPTYPVGAKSAVADAQGTAVCWCVGYTQVQNKRYALAVLCTQNETGAQSAQNAFLQLTDALQQYS